MSKSTILDEVLVTFEVLGKLQISMGQICSQVTKTRKQNNRDVGILLVLNPTFVGVF